jgi:DNA primase
VVIPLADGIGTLVSGVTDEIKARVDLVELIGRTVQLKRVGSQYRGLCPFHAEKTPSFYVRPQTGSWHCFGCNKSGTAFDWLMEREHLEFGEALHTLANLTGVALPDRRDPEAEDQTRRLYTILERAQTFYSGLLKGSSGGRARDYLSRRGLQDETLDTFGLGSAPSGNGLLRYLENDGFSEQELQAAGVIGVTEEEGRPYDFLRERVLFPIRDAQGRTIAFGGRSLDDAAQPKYLNTRETLLFHKNETLFAFDVARKPMAQERQVVVVEGYMDAVMAHQHGYRNVVATLGTAVTDRHLRLLRRHVDEIVLALDADAAGQAATWRALQVADESLRTGVTPVVGPNRRQQRFVADRAVRLRVLALPNAKDPDELIRSDPNTWPALVGAAATVVDFVLERMQARHDLTTAEGKSAAANEIVEVLAGIANPIAQDDYTNAVAARLKVDPAAVRRLLRTWQQGARQRAQRPDRPSSPEPLAAGPADVRGDSDDDYLLALLMRLRALPDAPPVERPIDFALPESRELYRHLGSPEVPVHLQPYAERARRRLADVERMPTHKLLEDIEFAGLIIRRKKLQAELADVSTLLREGAIDRSEAERLLNDYGRQMGEVARLLPPDRESAGTR